MSFVGYNNYRTFRNIAIFSAVLMFSGCSGAGQSSQDSLTGLFACIQSLHTPSAEKTGIKLNHNFKIASNGLTLITIDFDAQKSIDTNPGKGYLLKPTIKIVKSVSVDGVSQTIGVEGGSTGLTGAPG